jgi:bifunctional non-homologous end joining protein LigD
LESFAKTSGSKGLQIYTPLNTPVTYDDTKPFAHELARVLERQHPELVVSDMKKALRVGKILVDWSQNDDHKTTICVYSLRARERPTVSTPVTWDEVENCLKRKDPNLLVFDSLQVLERVKEHGDLFEPVLKLKQKLPPLEALARIDPAASLSSKPVRRTAVARERQEVMGAKQSPIVAHPAKAKRKTTSRAKQKQA